MALVNTVISENNDGANKVTLTYDSATLAVTKVAWDNPIGFWTWTISKEGQPDITAVLRPGDKGQLNVPAGYVWGTGKGSPPNFNYQDSWTRS